MYECSQKILALGIVGQNVLSKFDLTSTPTWKQLKPLWLAYRTLVKPTWESSTKWPAKKLIGAGNM